MGALEPGDLPPTLDLEVTDGQSAATITSTTLQWLDHVAEATGTLPILYTSPGFVTGNMGSPAGLEKHARLWVAHWNVKCPNVPAPFTEFSFWQYDDMGTVSGIPGASAVDLNVFNGSAADLEAITVQPMSSTSSSGSSSSTTSASSSSSGAGGSSESGTSASGTTDAAAVGVGGGSSASTEPGGSGAGGSVTSSPGESSGCSTAPSRGGSGERAALWFCAALLAIASRRGRRRHCD